MNLLGMSLSGAVMILVIVVIRALVINRLPKKTFLVLWGITLMRLLVPYSVPSAFSVYSLLGKLLSSAKTEPLKASTAAVQPADLLVPGTGIVPSASTASAASLAVPPYRLVWMVGALICAVFFAVTYLRCRREFREALPVDGNFARDWLKEHRLYRSIRLRQSDRIAAPLTYGVFCPVILLPKHINWDDKTTLAYVLTHEYIHIRRFDAVSKLVMTAALCVHWFNPAVWLMYVLANRDMELSCDEAVIRRFGEGTKSAYAMTLIRMEETKSMLNPLCNNFSKNAIEERIVAIMKMKKTSLAALIGAASFVFGVATVFATSAKDDGNVQQRESDYVSDIPDVEWWTYDEYKRWLENEKVELQGMIGEKCWTGSRGEFVWTQEIVDETIAMYEDVLENIKNGMLYSKTIDGEEESLTLSSGSAVGEAEIYEGDAAASDFQENTIEENSVAQGDATAPGIDFVEIFEKYAPFGITYVEADGASGRGNVYLNGLLVSRFADVAPDGSVFSFTSAENGGMIVHTEYDSHGSLIGVQEMLPDAVGQEAKGQ